MAYATYTTKAVVCGSRHSYTSDRSFLLFTQHAGMLWANARSVREERSRQRGALQEFSKIRVSLVRGKSGWRIGSVSALGNAYQEAETRVARGAVTQVLRLLRKYLHGEENQSKIFLDTELVLEKLVKNDAIEADFWLTVFKLRLMKELGYIAPNDSYGRFLEDSWPDEVTSLPDSVLKATQKGEAASHL